MSNIDDCKLRDSAKKSDAMTDEMWSCILKENLDMIEEYLRNNSRLSDKTLPNYRSGLGIFFYWNYENNKNKPFYKITKREFLNYISWLVNRGFSSSALSFKKSCLSGFNNYIENVVADDMEECTKFKNYCRGLPPMPKNKVYKKKPLNKEEYEKLATYLTEKEEWQKLAYLEFSYASACRKDEARQLLKEVANYKPIEKEKDGVKITYYITHPIECKGSKRNSDKITPLSFDERAMNSIKKYLEWRGEDDCKYMFVTKNSKSVTQVSTTTFNRWTDEFTEVIGRRIHPHLLRSSKATIMSQEEGKDISLIQKLLGHQSSETTLLYVVRDESEDLDNIYS